MPKDHPQPGEGISGNNLFDFMLNGKALNHRKGETILETLIAMGVLLIGITMASAIMSSSIRNINSSKNRVVAVNLAKEGLESIRNIRDTNWLKFNSNRRDCWNHDPATVSCSNASGAITAGDYIVYKQPIDNADISKGWKWRLANIIVSTTAPPPNPILREQYYDPDKKKSFIWGIENAQQAWLDLTQLYIVDVDPTVNSDEDLADNRETNDQDTYNHAWLPEGENALGQNLAVKTNFRRQITISYLNDDATGGDPSDNRMLIRSKVTWREGKYEFSTDLATHLSDYLGRENLN